MIHALVQRDPSAEKGAGVLFLMRGNDAFYSCDVITGGSELDPHVYGGITPPVGWIMIEPIDTTATFPRAVILPKFPDSFERDYPDRTYKINDTPFMIHAMGRSTGCIGPSHSDWEVLSMMLNRAYQENGGFLEVRVEDTIEGYFED